ncbi:MULTISPECIES: hypothetical protein [Hymenobacter]|uniref:hypothetical protein n=1 Tax=Hymenobacter TaxID=89966 RepID=UPI001CF41EF5|nr:hypothetical protein [Hymenobacter pini]MCA8831213.1 hypothetical protein [Hymenobacter pini]
MHHDFYSDFEPEPELVFKTSDDTSSIRMWSGYFDSIISSDTPDEHGCWQGLAVFYHTDTGWYTSSPFQLTELGHIVERLRHCNDPTWDKNIRRIYTSLLFFFEQAERQHKKVIVEYF